MIYNHSQQHLPPPPSTPPPSSGAGTTSAGTAVFPLHLSPSSSHSSLKSVSTGTCNSTNTVTTTKTAAAESWLKVESDLNDSGFYYAANRVLPCSNQKEQEANASRSNMSNMAETLLRNFFSPATSATKAVESNVSNSKTLSPIYDVGGVLYPYNENMSCSIPSAPIALCLQCGAYLNPLVEFEADGKWCCALCGFENHGLINFDVASHPELQSYHTEYIEKIPFFGTLLSEADNSLMVIAISASLCRNESIFSALRRYLQEASPGMNIVMIVLDHNLRVLRLGSHTFSPLAIDVIANDEFGVKYMKEMLRKGLYNAPREVILDNFGILESVLHSSFSSYANEELMTLDLLVDFCKALKEVRSSTRMIKTVVMIDAPLRSVHVPASQNKNYAHCSFYDTIGRVILQFGCALYCIYLGLKEGNFSELDSLVAATGGVLCVAESFDEFHVLSLLQKLLKVPNRYLHPHDLATIDVRCSPGLQLDRITGPMASLDDVSAARNHIVMDQSEKLATAGDLVFDHQHVEIAFKNMSNAHHDATEETTAKAFLDTKDSLRNYCKDRVSLCGVFPSEGNQTMVTFQFRESCDKKDQIFSSLSKMSKMMQIDSSRPDDSEVKASNVAFCRNDCSFVVQIICRYYSVTPDSNNPKRQVYETSATPSPIFKRHVLNKITRVWTIPFKAATSKMEFASSIETQMWSLILLRGVVADFHERLLEKFGGPKPTVLEEEESKLYEGIKRSFISNLDNLLKDISLKWGSHCPRFQDIARAIYHLREGPLLDGPSATSQEAFHLRSVFLKSSFNHSNRLLVPQVRLDIINLLPTELSPTSASPSSIKHQPLPLKDMDADSTSLIPLTIALVDFGNLVIVRRNATQCSKYAPGMDGEAFMYRLKSIGEQICQGRFPPSKFIVINSAGTPADRHVYSRLSPSHMASKIDIYDRISSMSEFSWVTSKDIETLIDSMPITDQIHFQQYVSLNAPHTLKSKDRKNAQSSQSPLPPQVCLPPRIEVMERDSYTGLPIDPSSKNKDDSLV